jgi:uncharacterized membrane protein YkvA (DUF1232 family)
MRQGSSFSISPFVLWGDFKGALAMFWAVARGKYPMPVKSILWAFAGFVYLLLPIDALPEAAFLLLGFTDDLLVLAYVLNKMRPDIENYKRAQKKVIKDEKTV